MQLHGYSGLRIAYSKTAKSVGERQKKWAISNALVEEPGHGTAVP